MNEFRRNIDSLCMTDGTGVLGTVSAVNTGAGKDTLTLATDGYGARLMRFGQMLSVYNAGLTTRRVHTGGASLNGEAPIDLYDAPNKQVRLNGTTGATIPGDKVVVSGLTATPPVSLLGVPYHHSNASTGFWLSMDRSSTPEIRANRVNASGALALPFPRLAINKIGDRVGMDNMMKVVAWMHPCQQQAYEGTRPTRVLHPEVCEARGTRPLLQRQHADGGRAHQEVVFVGQDPHQLHLQGRLGTCGDASCRLL